MTRRAASQPGRNAPRRGGSRGNARASARFLAGIAPLLAALFLAAAPARAISVLTGPVTHVRDGDTVEVEGQAVRLQGLHAPEFATPAGERAAAWMRTYALGRTVTCRLTGEASYDRVVGVCRAGGADLAAGLIAAGLGRDCPRYSGGRYAALETDAGKALALPPYCRPR